MKEHHSFWSQKLQLFANDERTLLLTAASFLMFLQNELGEVAGFM